MQFAELLPKRRMVRHYAPDPVSREAIGRPRSRSGPECGDEPSHEVTARSVRQRSLGTLVGQRA